MVNRDERKCSVSKKCSKHRRNKDFAGNKFTTHFAGQPSRAPRLSILQHNRPKPATPGAADFEKRAAHEALPQSSRQGSIQEASSSFAIRQVFRVKGT